MKSCIPAIRSLLLAAPGVTSVVAQRVWLLTAAEGQPYPDIVVYEVSGAPWEGLAGAMGTSGRRITVECRSTVYKQADDLGEIALAVIGNFYGVVGDQHIEQCVLVSDVPDRDETSAVYRRIMDFRVTHRLA